jgi:DNA-binding transcriptional MerR regulator
MMWTEVENNYRQFVQDKSMTKEFQGAPFNISAVERDTGFSKDVLRMWERRYGFPKPSRDDNGERQYTPADVGKLRAMKRLMDVGLRPGKIIGFALAELNAMADARAPARRDDLAPSLERDVMAMLTSHDVAALQGQLATLLMRQGCSASCSTR